MKRRKLIKGLSLIPITGSVLSAQSVWAAPAENGFAGTILPVGTESAAFGALKNEPNIFRSIGVEPIVNCRGTFTIIGGSIERPEVRAAMEAASKDFVQYDELAFGIGRRLAELTGAEWGMVSAGCAAAMKHVTAACVTGGNPEKLIRIPDLSGFEKTEVIIPRMSRNAYDHAIRNIGVTIVEVNTQEELESAINPRTAMIYLMADDPSVAGKPLTLEAIAKVATPKNIPILVDAAAEVLTIPCVHLQRGATLVAYSGGKAICGPQCAGLLLGKKDILMSAWQASSPHHGPGRDNKVGREEMLGMLAGVEAWIKRDHKAEWKQWLSWLDHISKKVSTIDGVQTKVEEPTQLSNRSPVLHISWNPDHLHITGEELAEEVGRNKPRIAIGSRSEPGTTSITITTGQMQPGNEKVVADRIYGILTQKRSPRSTEMPAPSATISGRWDVKVEFFSSQSQHSLTLEQDGNWLQGSHKGDFSVRDIAGTIEGDQVKLRSVDRNPGDSITFIFSGTVSGETISGNIHMGEYLTAKFTANRYTYKGKRQRIMVPGGPPLAT
ncbi:aminotransferase class V-fold PLP-dependent enzyme [Rhodocytophaga rosea]|uniref:Aminotransferase class V-fold PLP-dependent enzyme n=1 Tax=Rhodocytophaga rosea TaxID=2704465 RepID=A0A6C0GEL5_9BACT|nr:aminotransferase class V-fold PLP-dependent enzyme [Rhodocytophaga rosea]QHT66431.1 aminotransferase class V-fold PLP-dependent enzyme [Rhodocytophaga rosea]